MFKEYIISYLIDKKKKKKFYMTIYAVNDNSALKKAWKVNNKIRSKYNSRKLTFNSFKNRSIIVKKSKIGFIKFILNLFK